MSTPPPLASPAPPATGRRHPTSGVVALITGILGLSALPLIGSILALVFGGMSRREVAADPATFTDELGRVGRILGWIGVALALIGVVLALLAVVLFMPV